MSKPALFPEQTASGIVVDPRTLERVIPESKRSDGSVRKELKIRPGFTPQEDVSRFRGTRQQAKDATALPKGHILGWIAPSSETKAKGASAPPPNKNARKRSNQKARKAAEKAAVVQDSWEDDEDAERGTGAAEDAAHEPNTGPTQDEAEITDKLSKLEVK